MQYGNTNFLRLVFFAALCCPIRILAEEFHVASPDQKVAFKATVDDGRLRFAVNSHGATVIEASALVITLDGDDISRTAARHSSLT